MKEKKRDVAWIGVTDEWPWAHSEAVDIRRFQDRLSVAGPAPVTSTAQAITMSTAEQARSRTICDSTLFVLIISFLRASYPQKHLQVIEAGVGK